MRAAVLLLALVAAAALPAPPAAQPREQTVYASVVDKDRASRSTGLAVADFVVKEDGASREVLRAGRTGRSDRPRSHRRQLARPFSRIRTICARR